MKSSKDSKIKRIQIQAIESKIFEINKLKEQINDDVSMQAAEL